MAFRVTPLKPCEFAWHGSCASTNGKTEVRNALTTQHFSNRDARSRRVRLSKGRSFIEVIQVDDFIDNDPFIRLTDDRMEIGNKEIGAPHPHAGFEALGLLLEGAIRNRENGALLNAGDLIWLTAGSGI